MKLNSTYLIAETAGSDFSTTLRDFLVFSAILFDERLGLRQYEKRKLLLQNSELKSVSELVSSFGEPEEASEKIDYDDAFRWVYFMTVDKGTPPSIRDWWEKFRTLVEEDINLLSLYLFPVEDELEINSKPFYRPSFLQISLHFTVLEAALLQGKRRFCSSPAMSCEVCSRTNIQHEAKSGRQALEEELRKLPISADVAENYLDYINVAHRIRNSTFHMAAQDSAEHQWQTKSGTKTYDIRDYQQESHDSSALLNLSLGMKDIVRQLLLHRFFGSNYFQAVTPLKSMQIGNFGGIDER